MAPKMGFDDRDMQEALKIIDRLGLEPKEVNRAASNALIPGVHRVREGIKSFQGSSDSDNVSLSLLLSRMVRRKMSRAGFLPGARIVIDGPDIPMGNRDWSAKGVADLFKKDDTGQRTTRGTGANRGVFEGKSVGAGDNYVARFAREAESKINATFLKLIKAHMKKDIKNAVNGR